MFYSERYRLLFVAAPKTGSTSVESYLSQLDPAGERWRISLRDRVVDSRHVRAGSLGHATAEELQCALGEEQFNALRVFGLVRHPIDKLVSAYFFMRQRRIREAAELKTPRSKAVLVARRTASIMAARLLPFEVWSLLYPMKRCSDYYLDDSGRLLVDHLGATERLGADMLAILHDLEVSPLDESISHENRSVHRDYESYLNKSGFLSRWLLQRYRLDTALYELVRDGDVKVDRYAYLSSYCARDAKLTASQAALKRSFDLVVSAVGLVAVTWLIGIAWLLAAIDTRDNGFFTQQRIGFQGEVFKTIKIRTMRSSSHNRSTVTTRNNPRITSLGRFFRKTKIDELPQLWNVLIGTMSLVGPRPDVPGFADRLKGDDRLVLSVRPGITGPASLKYRGEEALLAEVRDAEAYNSEVIFPDKVRINKDYVRTWAFWKDVRYIVTTVMGRDLN